LASATRKCAAKPSSAPSSPPIRMRVWRGIRLKFRSESGDGTRNRRHRPSELQSRRQIGGRPPGGRGLPLPSPDEGKIYRAPRPTLPCLPDGGVILNGAGDGPPDTRSRQSRSGGLRAAWWSLGPLRGPAGLPIGQSTEAKARFRASCRTVNPHGQGSASGRVPARRSSRTRELQTDHRQGEVRAGRHVTQRLGDPRGLAT
jgi:hypothetical protein